MQTVVVKKQHSRRMAVRFFTLFFLVVPVAVACFIELPVWFAVLMCLPVIAGMILMLLYYETWQICFGSDGIRRKIFGFSGAKYSYHQIKDIVYRWSYTEQGIIRITFTDNRSVKFRADDENAEKARRRILSFHSIRNI